MTDDTFFIRFCRPSRPVRCNTGTNLFRTFECNTKCLFLKLRFVNWCLLFDLLSDLKARCLVRCFRYVKVPSRPVKMNIAQ